MSRPATAPRVSLSMIVKDGGGTLDRCLGSVAGLVDEVVVVDTGSKDDSRAIAAAHGARVFDVPWRDSFAAARNASLDRATGDWVFWLDADEWLGDDARRHFHALTAQLGDDPVVLFLRQASPLSGQGAGTLCVAQPRLFRAGPGIRWKYRVHEQILESCLRRGDVPRLGDAVISHSGYVSADLTTQKRERNGRLLRLELDENPDDPFVLLQFGRLALEDGSEDACEWLSRALDRLASGDSLRRQIYAAIVNARLSRRQLPEASQYLREGLAFYPNDTNLLDAAGSVAFEEGDLERAESCFQKLITTLPDADEFLGPVDLAVRGWRVRHNLAVICFRQGRADEAEAHWRAALSEKPDAAHLWQGFSELLLAQARWDELGDALARLETLAPESSDVSGEDVVLLRARSHLAREEFVQARAVLEEAIARHPVASRPRLLLSHATLNAGDLDAAEEALRGVLEIEPENESARRALAALLAVEDEEDDDAPDRG